MEELFIGRWRSRLGAALAAMAGCAVALVVACSSRRPDADGTASVLPPNACATPHEGCPCDAPNQAECAIEVKGDDDFVWCEQGTRLCEAGAWGACLTNGQMSVKSRSAPIAASGLHSLTYGTPGPCVGMDPCDPYCQQTTDTPTASVLTTIDGDTQCGAPPGTGNLHAATCTAANQYTACQQDFRCNLVAGTCVWNGGEGYFDSGVSGVDLTIGAACESPEQVPICNRGSGTVPAGTAVNLHIGGPSPAADACAPGAVSCSAPAPAGGLGPGKCMNLVCPIPGNKYGIVSATGITEPPGLCKNNQAYLKTSGAPGCAACVGTIAGGFGLRDGGMVALPAAPTCGDGSLAAGEGCDDGNLVGGDGCSSSCVIEIGYKCPTPGAPCTPTTCGDGVAEGAEQCDDSNLRPYDGCSPACQKEPSCNTGGCLAVCGDGVKFPSEACDDGNTVDGDGCSSTCAVEAGASCTTMTAALPPTIDVPVIFRDFTPATSPDFEFPFSGPGSLATGVIPGIAQTMLAADQEPAFLATHGAVTSATTFNQWWHDGPQNRVVLGTITLTKQPDDSYVYNSRLGAPDPYVSFFPIDGKGFGNFGATGHNYSFTSELRYPFTFQGGEVLDFIGDDDLWVFINGRLAVDLGGAHGPSAGSITLNAATAATFGLTAGNTYRLDVFQAERHSTGSSYKLTLRGFVQAKSVCVVPTATTFVRDFQAVCKTGEVPVWQLFRWKAYVPAGTSLAFRAATADTQAALPPSPPGAAPATVPIGTATPVNSPATGPEVWVNDVDGAGKPVPVSQHLRVDGANTPSRQWLRVYMTFSALGALSPQLDTWQQLYDCIPAE